MTTRGYGLTDEQTALERAGVSIRDFYQVDGDWPAKLFVMRLQSSQLNRHFSDQFDIFLPTRHVNLQEVGREGRRRNFSYKRGVIAFNPPDEDWTIEWEGIIEGFSFLLDVDTMNRAVKELLGVPINTIQWRLAFSEHAPAIAYLGLDIANQVATGYPAGKAFVYSQMQTFLMMLLRRYARSPGRDTRMIGVLSHQVLRAVQYIDSHLAEDLTVETICDASSISVAHLNRLFRAELNESVWSYVQLQRLRRARDLLKTTALTLSDIQKQCGYSTREHFTRQFKARYKMSPTHYREAR